MVAMKGYVEMAHLLLQSGANLEATNHVSIHVLYKCIIAITCVLLKVGEEVNFLLPYFYYM